VKQPLGQMIKWLIKVSASKIFISGGEHDPKHSLLPFTGWKAILPKHNGYVLACECWALL